MAQLRKDKRFALVKSLGRREYKFGYEDEPEGMRHPHTSLVACSRPPSPLLAQCTA